MKWFGQEFTFNLSTVMFVLIVVGALTMLLKWQKNHPLIDLSDLITGDNGRVSSSKFCQTGAWVVSTWGFASMIQQGKMTEWYFIGYMTAWTGYAALKSYISKQPTPVQEEPR
jgi:hypothetical protein